MIVGIERLPRTGCLLGFTRGRVTVAFELDDLGSYECGSKNSLGAEALATASMKNLNIVRRSGEGRAGDALYTKSKYAFLCNS